MKFINFFIKIPGMEEIREVDILVPDILVPDILREILIRSDLDTLKQYCLISKDAVKFYNDQYFWNDKLKLKGLPQILFDHDLGTKNLRMMNEYDIDNWYHYSEEFQSKNQWVILYNLMLLAMENAKMTLQVNKIETLRAFKITDGTITTEDSKSYIVESLYILPKEITTILTDRGAQGIHVQLEYKNENYKIKIMYDTEEEIDSELTLPISYHEALNTLTFLLFDKYIGFNPDMILIDSFGTEFYYDEEGLDVGDIEKQLKYLIYLTLNNAS